MDDINNIIAESTGNFLYLPESCSIDGKKAVPFSQISALYILECDDEHGGGKEYYLYFYIGKDYHRFRFYTKKSATKGKAMLESFIDQKFHSNEIKDLKNDIENLKNDIEEIKELIKCLPILGEEYKKAKDHFHNPDNN